MEKIDFEKTDTYVCDVCGYASRGVKPPVCSVCDAPAEKFQRLDKEAIQDLVPLEGGAEEEETFDNVTLKWTADARTALREVPGGYQRRRARAQIEKSARTRKIPTITKEMVLQVAGETLEDTENLEEPGKLKKSATVVDGGFLEGQELIKDTRFSWTADAMVRLNRVPEGFMRNITKGRIETCAESKGVDVITLAVAEEGIAIGRKMMEEMVADYKKKGKAS